MDSKIEIVTYCCFDCVNRETGDIKGLCFDEIVDITERGNIAFMIYSVHVDEEFSLRGYETHVRYENNAPVGLYIKRGSF